MPRIKERSAPRRALVTGASSGIGLAFAHVLAERGHDLILTARRQDRLETLAFELRTRHGIDAVVMAEDLADPLAPERLVSSIARRALHVDVLVNNAGYGVPGSYATTTWTDQQKFLQVLVVAVAELTHRLLPGMIERRWGRIINVASLAGMLPGVAGHTLYAASKAFVIKFSESLALETMRHGLHVTASCPGFTFSEFHDVTGTRAQVSRMPKLLWLDADVVARASYDAVMAGVPVFVPGRVNATLATLSRVLPRSIVWGLMKRNATKFRRV
ncbi:MAG TPA: SDR family oxidoreductase [Vicinamibacterales bacterium]|nr:SDR family oxidoreductase [Vicinamibacterales bacterium]